MLRLALFSLTLVSLVTASPLAPRQASTAPLFEAHQNATPATYPYGVHQPVNRTDSSPPPAIVFLHGFGSIGQYDDIQNLLTYNGFGWLLKQYQRGNTSEAAVQAATDFLQILLLDNDPDFQSSSTDSEGVTTSEQSWDASRVLPTLADAASRYAWDTNRTYLVGYSMGARAVWQVLFNSTEEWSSILASNGTNTTTNWPTANQTAVSPWAAAIAVAGEPYPSEFANLTSIVGLPMRHVHGSQDDEDKDQDPEATQEAAEEAARTAGKNNTLELVTVNSGHEELQYSLGFNVEMMNWLLSHSANATSTNATALAPSTSASAV